MKIIFFSPFSAVLPHKKAEVLLAHGLQKKGHDIFFINCDGVFGNYCIAMSANGLNELSDINAKKAICTLCRGLRDWNNLHFKFKNRNIDDNLSVDEVKQIDDIMKFINQDNCFEFIYDGFEIGKIASYEFLINHKKIDLNLTANEWRSFSISVRNTLITYFAFKKIIKDIKPDVVAYYDGGYSVNGMVKELALKNNILAYDFYGGLNVADRYSKLVMVKEDSSRLYKNLKEKIWPIMRDRPIGQAEIENIGKHIGGLFKAKDFAVYSSPRISSLKNIRVFFEILPEQKILVATLSSYDERFAENILGRTVHEKDTLFQSQTEWCLSLIEWIKKRQEYFLIIRVHPREFPNKREATKSVHAKKLEIIFSNLPKNVKVNWPTDNISLYNLAEDTDVFLNAWSTAGVEMSLLGIPVVVYSPEMLYYPSDLNYVGASKEEYFSKIEEAILAGWSFERIRMTFRWCATLFSFSTISMKENIFFDFFGKFFRLLRRITKSSFFDNIINYFYFRRFFFSKNTIKSVEIMFENKLDSLADVYLHRHNKTNQPDKEAIYICDKFEELLKHSESNILSKIRNYSLHN